MSARLGGVDGVLVLAEVMDIRTTRVVKCRKERKITASVIVKTAVLEKMRLCPGF